jgi:hypothetical protein
VPQVARPEPLTHPGNFGDDTVGQERTSVERRRAAGGRERPAAPSAAFQAEARCDTAAKKPDFFRNFM